VSCGFMVRVYSPVHCWGPDWAFDNVATPCYALHAEPRDSPGDRLSVVPNGRKGSKPSQATLCMLCYAICCNLNFAVLCHAMLCCVCCARVSPRDRLSVFPNGRKASKGSQLMEAMPDRCNA